MRDPNLASFNHGGTEVLSIEQTRADLAKELAYALSSPRCEALPFYGVNRGMLARKLYDRTGGQIKLTEAGLKTWYETRLTQLKITSFEALLTYTKEHPDDLAAKPEDFGDIGKKDQSKLLLSEIRRNMPFSAPVGPFTCQLRYEYRGDEFIERNRKVNITVCFPEEPKNLLEAVAFYEQLLQLTQNDLPQGTPLVPFYETLQLKTGSETNQFLTFSALQEKATQRKLDLDFRLKFSGQEKIIPIDLTKPLPDLEAIQQQMGPVESYGSAPDGSPLYPSVMVMTGSANQDLINSAREVLDSGKTEMEWALSWCSSETDAQFAWSETIAQSNLIRTITNLYREPEKTKLNLLNRVAVVEQALGRIKKTSSLDIGAAQRLRKRFESPLELPLRPIKEAQLVTALQKLQELEADIVKAA